MTDLRTLVTKIFPDGEFVVFNEIRTGDTIIRGGAYIGDNSLMTEAVHIGKVIVIKRDPYNDDVLTCFTDDRPLGAVIAVESLTQGWYYRIPMEVDEYERPDVNSSAWVHLLLDKYIKPYAHSEEIGYEDVRVGDVVFTADMAEGDTYGDVFVPDAHIGVVAFEDDYGWGVTDVEGGEPLGFTLVLRPENDPDSFIYRVKG